GCGAFRQLQHLVRDDLWKDILQRKTDAKAYHSYLVNNVRRNLGGLDSVKKFYIIGFIILMIFDTFTQISFKIAADNTAPAALTVAWIGRLLTEKWIYFAVASYLGAFVTYMTVLKHAPVGPAFAATHLEIVTVLIASVMFMGEKMTLIQVL